ncbi:MAG TPA: helix-turn-helix domain-containing protein [Polyangiaceae bacterium]|nr:helix-turn-helix domain-containing protein [Polyangiaceae bacterium]
MRDATPTPAANRRTQRILAAATALFGRYGFQRTSVDQVAAEAGVAKGTVYAHFADKEALFRAVCQLVCDDLLARARAAAAAPGPLDRRLLATLEAKFVRVFELVHRSPHASELLQSQERLGLDIVEQTDQAYVALLESMLAEASSRGDLDPRRAGVDAPGLALLLLAWSDGIVRAARDEAALRRSLAQSVALALGGLRPAALAAETEAPSRDAALAAEASSRGAALAAEAPPSSRRATSPAEAAPPRLATPPAEAAPPPRRASRPTLAAGGRAR